VFSDADAKDADREDEVKAAALDKNITVTFLLTGTCKRRGRRETQGIVILFICCIFTVFRVLTDFVCLYNYEF
jgi:hypothetical protein